MKSSYFKKKLILNIIDAKTKEFITCKRDTRDTTPELAKIKAVSDMVKDTVW